MSLYTGVGAGLIHYGIIYKCADNFICTVNYLHICIYYTVVYQASAYTCVLAHFVGVNFESYRKQPSQQLNAQSLHVQ